MRTDSILDFQVLFLARRNQYIQPFCTPLPFLNQYIQKYYRKRRSASYIVCEVRSVRERERDTERERERERERDGSDVTLVALKLPMSFALFLAKSFAP